MGASTTTGQFLASDDTQGFLLLENKTSTLASTQVWTNGNEIVCDDYAPSSVVEGDGEM